MSIRKLVAWDVGGAHLKCAQFDLSGKLLEIEQFSTPLWQGIGTLLNIIEKFALNEHESLHVITMTAELSDIYSSRKEGVLSLSRLFIEVFSEQKVLFYAAEKGFFHFSEIHHYIESIASMNWHATASYLANECASGILIDIGSSTTDLIPFSSSKLLNNGYTDHERLIYQELIYFGVVRTALMAICNEFKIHHKVCPLMNEIFATTADVYRILGLLDEQNDMQDAADGKEKTVDGSARRLARMIGLDFPIDVNMEQCKELAMQVKTKQIEQISQAVEFQLNKNSNITFENIIGAGCGRFLLNEVANRFSMKYLDFYHYIDTSDNKKHKAANYATVVSIGKLFLKNYAKFD